MARPVTLFTGQFADIPIAELALLAKNWGYDGLELACWGDHFEVDKALVDPSYAPGRRALLEQHGLGLWAISNHLVGQAVSDRLIDERHQGTLPARIWGNGDPEIQGLLAEITRRGCEGPKPPVAYSREAAGGLKNASFDVDAIAAQGLGYERLDQLTTEILLGAR